MMAQSATLASQRGAGMLMATVFLLIVIALFGLIGLRMAGTDITDTSLQNDSVEALFLAESGLERAAQRLASGTTCDNTGLAEAAQTLGRGSFEIQSATPVGSLCRVTVIGSVGLAGATPAQRLIEGDFQVGSGGTWAVGDVGTILNWSGSAWTASASGVANNLNDVSCASANSCWAVGSGGTVLHWTGAWAPASTGIPGNVTLNSIACVPNSADDCIAVGSSTFIIFPRGVVYHYNGGTWTSVHTAALFTSYTDAYCTTSECYTVGSGGLVGRWDGGWNNENANTGQNLNGVACSSDNDCWAVGPRQGNSFFYDRRTGGGWSPQPVNDPGDRRDLYDVSCPADNDCWAVGERRTGNRYTLTHWDGSNWTADFLTLANADNLNAVSCVNGSDCWAVGDNGDTLRRTGSSWSYIASGTAQDLNGVYMSGNAGSTTLQRWREIIQ